VPAGRRTTPVRQKAYPGIIDVPRAAGRRQDGHQQTSPASLLSVQLGCPSCKVYTYRII
jgi:hypothetical protein